MVSFSQSCHYFSFNKLPTPVAAGTIHALVIQGAKVFPVLNEKASLCQVTATHWKKKNTTHIGKYIYKRRQKQSVLPTNEITLVALLLYIGFLPSPTVTTWPWQDRRWLAFFGYKKPCNQKLIWRNLHSHNFNAFRPHQYFSYLVLSC